DAARSMTTDAGLTPSDMLQIAESLRGVSSQDVQFVTAPNAPYPPDPDEVEFQQPRADALFSAIAHDSRLPPAAGRTPPGKQSASCGNPMAAAPAAHRAPATLARSPARSAPPDKRHARTHLYV